ncbi:MAG TPA: hypothetical protein VGK48_06995 [Terriglobia bacterium]|jgi:hypothetical protein
MDLSEFVRALARSVAEGISRNKLPACLSLIAVILTTALALTSEYDERPRYRKFILPGIHRAEMQFFDVMKLAESEPEEPQRTLYFIEAHRRANNALNVIRSERPMTATGRKAQLELTHYYELVDEDLAIIRTEMSNDPSYDYIAEWKRTNSDLLHVRDRWLKWLNAGKN